MALHALLFSRDQAIIDLAGEVLKTLDIEVAQSTTAQDAVQRLTSTTFDAIIVDNADARGAVAVLSAAKSLPSCEQSIGIVLAVSPSSIGLADGARSHMVLYRPLSADRLRTGVKSALGLRNAGEDARESPRASIRIPATLRGAGAGSDSGFHYQPQRRRGCALRGTGNTLGVNPDHRVFAARREKITSPLPSRLFGGMCRATWEFALRTCRQP